MTDTYFSVVRREPFLTAYWRQNDPSGSFDMTDYASHFGLTGTYTTRSVGPSLIQADAGSFASSFGSAGEAQVSDATPLHIVSDISIEAWIIPFSATETTNLISKQNSGATHAGPYALKLVSGQIAFSLGNGTTEKVLTGGTPLIGIPSHVVATSFRGAMKIYLNGAVVATGTLGAQAVADGGQSLVIGKTTSENGIDLISEVALYSGALSARRVGRHFAIGQQVLADPSHYMTVDPPVVD